MPPQIEKLSALLNILTFFSSLNDSQSGWCVFNEIQRDCLSNILIFKIFLKYFEFKNSDFQLFLKLGDSQSGWCVLNEIQRDHLSNILNV